MKNRIENLTDVRAFAEDLVGEGTSFHPDDDFANYVNVASGQPSYSKAEAVLRNKLMSQCVAICEKEGVNLYDTLLETYLIGTGLNKIIPLPTQAQTEN